MRYAVVVLLAVRTVGAQSAPASEASVAALLAEVKQLRLALERTSALAPRLQVTLHRIQMQQEAVNRATREADSLRGQATEIEQRATGLAAAMKEIEAGIANQRDPQQRSQLEEQLRQIKRAGEEIRANESSLRVREAEVGSRLRLEQARLDELNARLESLEKLLDAAAGSPR